ncbi:MAG: hypothetical protein KAQ69_11050 [Spirochaetales bacterium]|nr:hypothetical protein [Spirochaetales bacterium]
MKYKIAVVLVVLFALFSVQVFAEESVLTVPEYLQLVLESSTGLDTAKENAENAAEAYDEAVLTQASAYDLELLRINAEYLGRNVLAVQNAEVLAAMQRFFAYKNAARSLDFAVINEEIVKEEYRRTLERFESDLISTSDKEQFEISYINSTLSRMSSENNLGGLEKQIFRTFLSEWEDLSFADFIFSETVLRLPEKSELITASLLVEKLEAEISIKEEKQIQLNKSSFASPLELEQIESELDSLRDTLQNHIWSLEDSLDGFAVDTVSSTLSQQTAALNTNNALRQLETTKLLYQQGEIYQSNVAQANLQYLQKIQNQVIIKQNNYLQSLELQAMLNKSLLELFPAE